MKKLLSIILFLSIAMFSYAQKGSVSKAKSYRSKGDLINAKVEIDMAITIEKVAKKSATWFERGEIYKIIALNEDKKVRNIDTEALVKAHEAYKKVLSMEKENSVNAVFSAQHIESLWGHQLNKGDEQYNEKDYKGAYDSFVNALKIKSEDSITLLYAAIVAQQSENYENMLLHYNKMVSLNKANIDVFLSLIYIERNINKDEEKALEIIDKAKKNYPSELRFRQEEIAILINLNKLDEAKEKIESEIEKDSTNVNLYLNLAIMHDNIGASSMTSGNTKDAEINFKIAKKNYKKAVELESENYVANFNLAAIYVNSAKVYYDVVREMDLKTYNKEGPALVKKADAILNEGLPYMKKSTEVKPDDIDALKALQQMYTQLKMFDEAETILDKIEVIEGGG